MLRVIARQSGGFLKLMKMECDREEEDIPVLIKIHPTFQPVAAKLLRLRDKLPTPACLKQHLEHMRLPVSVQPRCAVALAPVSAGTAPPLLHAKSLPLKIFFLSSRQPFDRNLLSR